MSLNLSCVEMGKSERRKARVVTAHIVSWHSRRLHLLQESHYLHITEHSKALGTRARYPIKVAWKAAEERGYGITFIATEEPRQE